MKFRVEGNPTSMAKMKVIGVGGAGGNSVDRMVQVGIQGVEFIVANTDEQDIRNSRATKKIQLGTKGLGAGANPEVGAMAAKEMQQQIVDAIQGADLLFITAGMGGGTGTGGAPVVAEIARDMGILTIAVVTKPFSFEGPRRMQNATAGIAELRKFVDALIVIPNDKVLEIAGNMEAEMAYKVADDILRQGVQGISDIILYPGRQNIDFADVRRVLENKGTAHMGIGIGEGEHRATKAIENAIKSELLESSIDGAQSLLINIAHGSGISLNEYSEAVNVARERANNDVEIIFGTTYNDELNDKMVITIVATGLGGADGPQPRTLKSDEQPVQTAQTQSEQPVETPYEPTSRHQEPARKRRSQRDADSLKIPIFLRDND